MRKSGAWYTYDGDQLGQGKENSRKFLLENPAIALDIEQKIMFKLGVGAEAKAAANAKAAEDAKTAAGDAKTAGPSGAVTGSTGTKAGKAAAAGPTPIAVAPVDVPTRGPG